MIVHNVTQGSPEWSTLRLGIPTASQFSRILTPKTRRPSASQDAYLCELLAERLTGFPCDAASTDFMLRGSDMEAEAVASYAFDTDTEPKVVGFVTDDAGRYGCSPDRLVGEDGGLEIKCLSAKEHVAAIIGLKDDDHAMQVQGCMWVTGRSWWDLYFYNPVLPKARVRIERDPELIAVLAQSVEVFCDRLAVLHEMILSGEMDAIRTHLTTHKTPGGKARKGAATDATMAPAGELSL